MITTKGRDFALPLVRRAHLGVSDELVFGLEAGKKVRSLTFFPLLTRTHTQTYKHTHTHPSQMLLVFSVLVFRSCCTLKVGCAAAAIG